MPRILRSTHRRSRLRSLVATGLLALAALLGQFTMAAEADAAKWSTNPANVVPPGQTGQTGQPGQPGQPGR